MAVYYNNKLFAFSQGLKPRVIASHDVLVEAWPAYYRARLA